MAYRKSFECSTVTKSAFEMKHVIYFSETQNTKNQFISVRDLLTSDG